MKTSATIPGSLVRPIQIDGTSGVKEASGTFDHNHAMIQNVLLPILTGRISNGDLTYSVGGSITALNRGVFTDTKQTATSNTQSFTNPTYYTTSTPIGVAVTQNIYYLNLA